MGIRFRSSPRALAACCAAMLLALSVAACGGGSSGSSSSSSGTGATNAVQGDDAALVVNLGQLVPTLDPASACHLADAGVTNALYAQLTRYGTKTDDNGEEVEDASKIEPYLADSWTVSDDGTVYTFKLHPDMKFPSGDPVDAKAFKYSLERTVKINGCGAYGIVDGLYDPPQFKKIETPAPDTLKITLGQPNVNFLQNLAQWSGGVVDPKLVEANGGVKKNTPNEWMASHSAGYGPFLLDSYEPNKQAVLVANPDFIDPPASKKIIVNFFSASEPLVLAARSGRADVTLVAPKQAAKSLASNACCKVLANPIPAWEKIALPAKVAPFDNEKLREALTYAVPYDQIISSVAFGYGTPFYGPWSPAMPWYNPEIGKARPYDVDKAKQLIAESGLKTPIKFNLITPQGNAAEKQLAAVVQQSWKQIGVDVTVRTVTVAQQLDDAYSTHKNAVMFYDGPGVIAPDYLWDYDMKCGSAFNSDQSCDPAADKMVAKLRHTTDDAARKKITDAVAESWVSRSPRIQVYQDSFVTILNKRVKDYVFFRSAQYRTWAK